jgi:hypothetical protein
MSLLTSLLDGADSTSFLNFAISPAKEVSFAETFVVTIETSSGSGEVSACFASTAFSFISDTV